MSATAVVIAAVVVVDGPRGRRWHAFCFSPCVTIQSYRDLDAWTLGMELVDHVIALTRTLPRAEFELCRQMRAAAVSIPSNVAEGWRRKHRRSAYQNHVSIAMGSQGELATQIEVALRNGWFDTSAGADLVALCSRVGHVLDRLHDSLY